MFFSCSFCPLEGSAISCCTLSWWKGSSRSTKEATSLCAEEREHTAWGRRGGEELGKGKRGEGRRQGRGGEGREGDTHYSEFKKLMGGL